MRFDDKQQGFQEARSHAVTHCKICVLNGVDLALVVRRRSAIDDMHERGELGSRYWSDRSPDVQWDPYLSTTSSIQMRGGRLYKLKAEEQKPAADPPPGMMGFQRPNEEEDAIT
jgi:hypothetical protein